MLIVTAACNEVEYPSQPFTDEELTERVDSIRQEFDLPAFGVLIQSEDDVPQIHVSGIRRMGGSESVLQSDMWFIGSAAKSMTATLLAVFVQEGKVSFETTLYELFPEYSDSFTDKAKSITIAHLLSHASGLSTNPAESLVELRDLVGDVTDPVEQRKIVLARAVSDELLFEPGSQFSYSNTGYVLAGAVIERIGGHSYESLLATYVFEPLGIVNYGFGHPALDSTDGIDQPWGHRPLDDGLVPVSPDDSEHVNPRLFDPAGNLHVSLGDWAMYAREHLNGTNGQGVLLESPAFERLNMPRNRESGYALGWGVLVENEMPIMLTHSGSDGNWFADIRIYPSTNKFLLLVSNDGREDAEAAAAMKTFRREFNKRYSPFP